MTGGSGLGFVVAGTREVRGNAVGAMIGVVRWRGGATVSLGVGCGLGIGGATIGGRGLTIGTAFDATLAARFDATLAARFDATLAARFDATLGDAVFGFSVGLGADKRKSTIVSGADAGALTGSACRSAAMSKNRLCNASEAAASAHNGGILGQRERG